MIKIIKCENVELYKSINFEIDIVKIYDNFNYVFYAFEKYVTALMYKGHELECTIRNEMIDSEVCEVITDVTIRKVVTLLPQDSLSSHKLYSNEPLYKLSNVFFSEDSIGDEHLNAIVYCLRQSFKSSQIATWIEYIICDKEGRRTKLYRFSPTREERDINFTRKYLIGTLMRTQYGYQTTYIHKYSEEEVGADPETLIAIKYLTSVLEDYPSLRKFCDDTNFLTKLADYFDEEYYNLSIKLAREVYLAISLTNMSAHIRLPLLLTGLVCSYAYILNNNKSQLSRELQSLLQVSRHSISKEKDLLYLLDINQSISIVIPEVETLRIVKEMVSRIDNLQNIRGD